MIHRINILRILLVCSGLLIGICSCAQAAEYRLHVLANPTQTLTYNYASRINSAGQVVGYCSDSSSSSTHAVYLWDTNGLRFIGNGGGGAKETAGINDNGEVIYTAYVWRNGVRSSLPGLLPGPITGNTVQDINNQGIIVGHSQNEIGDIRPVYWDTAGIHALYTPGLYYGGYAMAINNSGRIVGNMRTTAKDVATMWYNGSFTSLGIPFSYDSSIALDVNDLDQVIGYSTLGWDDWNGNGYDSIHKEKAFLWQNGSFTDIGITGKNNRAKQINNKGQIVGYSYDLNQYQNYTAWVWENGMRTELAGLGSDTLAYGINDNGWVVGRSYLDGKSYAVMWEPIAPEPSSLLGLSASLGACACFMRRRNR